MCAAANGMALHGGLIPYTGTFFVFTDYMRPAIRIGAIMRQRVIHVLTHDSIGLGEDGPTHQPIEHLASLRAMPNLHVFRPADAMETAECWELAIRRTDGPSLLVLTPPGAAGAAHRYRPRTAAPAAATCWRRPKGPRQATLIATGSEVSIAMDARAAAGRRRASPSPWYRCPAGSCSRSRMKRIVRRCWASAPRVGIEAAGGFGWERWLGTDGIFIGMTDFGASAPYEDLYKHFGITAEALSWPQ